MREASAGRSPQRILLIRLRLIGDVVFTTPAVAATSTAISRRADLLSRRSRGRTGRSPQSPPRSTSSSLSVPRAPPSSLYDLRLARRLRRERFDLVIDFHGGPRSAWLTRATGAARRIGYDLPWRAWAYTTRLPWTRRWCRRDTRSRTSGTCCAARDSGVRPHGEPPVEMVVDDAAAALLSTRGWTPPA